MTFFAILQHLDSLISANLRQHGRYLTGGASRESMCSSASARNAQADRAKMVAARRDQARATFAHR